MNSIRKQNLGRQAEGRDWVARMRELAPQLTTKGIGEFLSAFFVPEAMAYQTDGLRAAGLPED